MLKKLPSLLIAIPFVFLAIISLTWLRYGIDFPLLDDWRNYQQGMMGHVELSYLFQHDNDTFYPVGKILDSLAFHLLDGNTIVYQFVSMIAILGSLLYLQWRLLRLSLSDPLSIACAFSLTLLMLQPDSYWGRINLAYHQALPLVCILAACLIVLRPTWNPRWALPGLTVLALISGLTYTSGAFTLLGLGAFFILVHGFIRPEENKALLQGGLALFAVSLITAGLQLWVVVGIQHGIYRPDIPLVWPTEARFWIVIYGLFSRSLLFSYKSPWLAFYFTLPFFTGLLAWVCYVLRQSIAKRPLTLDAARPLILLLGLFTVIMIYGAMISMGRGGFGLPGEAPFIDHYTAAIYRYHYFWMTLLWPWVMAVILSTVKVPPSWILGFSLVFVSLITVTGVLNPSESFRKAMQLRQEALACIYAGLAQENSVECPMIHWGLMNQSLLNAHSAGASFMHRFERFPLERLLAREPGFFRLPLFWPPTEVLNGALENGPEGLTIMASKDTQIIVKTDLAEALAKCKMIDLGLVMRMAESDRVQVLSDQTSVTIPLPATSDFHEIHFIFESENGFSNNLSVEPATIPQSVRIKSMELRCKI